LTVVTALLTVGNAPAWTNRQIPGWRAGRFVRPCGRGIEACRGVNNGRVPFGRKIKLPATVAIKHELRMMMAQDINKAELETVRKTSEEKSDD